MPKLSPEPTKWLSEQGIKMTHEVPVENERQLNKCLTSLDLTMKEMWRKTIIDPEVYCKFSHRVHTAQNTAKERGLQAVQQTVQELVDEVMRMRHRELEAAFPATPHRVES
jgi:chemotaxis protein histidine kinase CheA